MDTSLERIRASRLSDRLGAALIALGVVGLLLVVLLTAWIVHDLDKATGSGGLLTISKIQAVGLVGVTPGSLSLLVIGFGAYLQTRSMELLLGVAVDSDFIGDDNDDDDFPESGMP
jgi:hypothetical protein